MGFHRKPASTTGKGRGSLRTLPLFVILLAGGVEAAEDAGLNLNLPAQALSATLDSLAKTSRVKLVYADAAVKGLNAQPLQGHYTVRQALDKVLGQNGLRYEMVDKTLIAVKTPELGSTSLPKVTVNAKAGYDASAPYNTEYVVPNAYAATKTDTPIMETPMSIQAVSRAVMDDQQTITLNDALKNVSGVQVSEAFYDGAIIRGFDTGGSTYRNGLRQAAISGLETANLRSIEVLKGPASILYGRIQPGGMINLAPKRALDIPYFSVQQQFGSYDLYRTTVDATGPLLADKSLLGRMNIAYKSNNSFRDFVSQENVFIAPSLSWRPTDNFEANLDVEYQHFTFTDDEGALVAVGTRPANIPISRYLQDGKETNKRHPNTQDKTLTAFDWTYHFNDDWRLTNRFQYTSTAYRQTSIWFGELDETTGVLTRGMWNTPLRRNTYASNLDLAGKFNTGDFAHHDVLVGFDFYRLDEHDGPGGPANFYGTPESMINIYHPVYSGRDLTQFNPGTENFAYKHYENWYGVYFQDQITLWDKLHILGGGRQDWASESSGESGTGSFSDITLNANSNQAFNPRVGVLYQPWEWLSLYGNYVESYGSLNGGRSFGGKPFNPETGQQGEVGIKAESPDKRVTATLAFYQIYKQNILATDAAHPLYSVAVGEARSRGIELDLSGKSTEDWSVIGTYAYTDAVITKGSNQGNDLLGVPKNSGSLWTRYEFSSGDLKGLSFGTGVFAKSQRQGDNDNSFQLPGYARWDASVGYSFVQSGAKITTQFNVYNILDKTHYDRSSWRLAVYPAQPLSFLGSIRVES